MIVSDIIDYISGRDFSKEKEIENWLKESPEHREQYFRMKELWAHKLAEESAQPERLEGVVAKIHSRILPMVSDQTEAVRPLLARLKLTSPGSNGLSKVISIPTLIW